jgi:hypothetical protein
VATLSSNLKDLEVVVNGKMSNLRAVEQSMSVILIQGADGLTFSSTTKADYAREASKQLMHRYVLSNITVWYRRTTAASAGAGIPISCVYFDGDWSVIH